MSLSLRHMTSIEFSEFLSWLTDDYAADLRRADGYSKEASRERAVDQLRSLLPRGVATTSHSLRTVVNSRNEPVGSVWFGPQTHDHKPAVFLYEIVIRPDHRKHGHASEVLSLLEHEALADGAELIALHVFEHNPPAIALYAACGYVQADSRPGHLLMTKQLAG
ncbi:MAG: GNAT family N-acetyltransferase [Acidimicrobiia bacterium]